MKTIITFLIAVLLISITNAQTTVSTFTDGTPDDAIALDSNGNIYASGFDTNKVFRFTPSGTMTEFISTGLMNPNGIDFDSTGFLYLCEWGANLIGRYDSNGILDGEITIPGNPSGMIKAFDNDDMIYTRYSGNTINRITPGGVITEVSSAPELNGPVGLAYDEFGVLYVGNYNNREIYKVLPNGDLDFVATVGSSSNLGFIAYAQGRLWGTVLGEHKIYTIEPTGTDEVSLFAGSTIGNTDGDISVATFNRPNGIRFNDTEDTMYITDYGSKNLRVISNVVLDIPGNNTFRSGIKLYPNPADEMVNIELNLPDAASGNLEVHDQLGRLIYSMDLEPTSNFFTETIRTDTWGSGVYLVSYTTGKSKLISRLIK